MAKLKIIIMTEEPPYLTSLQALPNSKRVKYPSLLKLSERERIKLTIPQFRSPQQLPSKLEGQLLSKIKESIKAVNIIKTITSVSRRSMWKDSKKYKKIKTSQGSQSRVKIIGLLRLRTKRCNKGPKKRMKNVIHLQKIKANKRGLLTTAVP